MKEKHQSLEEAARVIGRKKERILSDVPESKDAAKTAGMIKYRSAKRPEEPAPSRKRHYLSIDDLTSPPADRVDLGQCAEIIEDFKEFFQSRHIPIYALSDEDLTKKLNYVRIPGPRRLINGLGEIGYPNLSCVMADLPKPLTTAIALYLAKPEAYVKKREENIAYRTRALEVIREYRDEGRKKKKN